MGNTAFQAYYGPATTAEQQQVQTLFRLEAEYFPHESADTLVYHVRNTAPAAGKWDGPTLRRWASQALSGAPFTD